MLTYNIGENIFSWYKTIQTYLKNFYMITISNKSSFWLYILKEQEMSEQYDLIIYSFHVRNL